MEDSPQYACLDCNTLLQADQVLWRSTLGQRNEEISRDPFCALCMAKRLGWRCRRCRGYTTYTSLTTDYCDTCRAELTAQAEQRYSQPCVSCGQPFIAATSRQLIGTIYRVNPSKKLCPDCHSRSNGKIARGLTVQL